MSIGKILKFLKVLILAKMILISIGWLRLNPATMTGMFAHATIRAMIICRSGVAGIAVLATLALAGVVVAKKVR